MKVTRNISHTWIVKSTGVDGVYLGEVRATTKAYALRKAKQQYGENVFVKKAKQ